MTGKSILFEGEKRPFIYKVHEYMFLTEQTFVKAARGNRLQTPQFSQYLIYLPVLFLKRLGMQTIRVADTVVIWKHPPFPLIRGPLLLEAFGFFFLLQGLSIIDSQRNLLTSYKLSFWGAPSPTPARASSQALDSLPGSLVSLL